MHKSELTQRLANAVQAEAPAILPGVLMACDTKNAKQSKRRNNSSSFSQEDISSPRNTVRHYFNHKLWLSFAATLILLCGGAYFTYAQYNVTTVVAIDVNPNVELRINRAEKVLSATAQNADGKNLLEGLHLAGIPLEDAMDALIAALLTNGYMHGQDNSLLITVECGEKQSGAALQKELTQSVSRLLNEKQSDGAILSQTLQSGDEMRALAVQYNISIGKAALLQQLTQQNTHYNFAALAACSINDLHLLARETKTALNGILSIGTPGSKGYIGHEKAKSLALTHAKKAESAANGLDCHLDWDNGMVYTVAFDADGNKHTLTLDAQSGIVLAYTTVPAEAGNEPTSPANNSESTNTTLPGSTARNNTDIPVTQPYSQTTTQPRNTTQTTHFANGQTPTSAKATSAPATTQSAAVLIGESRAKEIALARANLSSGFTGAVEVDLERKNGKRVYEVEFEQGNIEYTCIIDAVTGDILKWEEDT